MRARLNGLKAYASVRVESKRAPKLLRRIEDESAYLRVHGTGHRHMRDRSAIDQCVARQSPWEPWIGFVEGV